MPIERWHRYTREQIQANPSVLFVFGDNMAGCGFGGQAKEARGEPNSVGIPTKHLPSMASNAFFKDGDLEYVKPKIQNGFRRLHDHLQSGGRVVWPMDGIGTDRARLAESAPLIRKFIDDCEKYLETFN